MTREEMVAKMRTAGFTVSDSIVRTNHPARAYGQEVKEFNLAKLSMIVSQGKSLPKEKILATITDEKFRTLAELFFEKVI